MKKIISILLAMLMVVTLFASCDSSSNRKDMDNGRNDTEENISNNSPSDNVRYITFGKYEQDNDTSNGMEDIEWEIVERDGNRVLIVSCYALDCQQYNTSGTDVTWETCTLRGWLNDDFFNTAFDEDEQSKILAVTVNTKNNGEYGTVGGNDTQDKVFLLSMNEAEEQFPSQYVRICEPTPYAIAQGADTNYADNGIDVRCRWWLRTPGNYQDAAVAISFDGSVLETGSYIIYEGNAVRPAMWIEL